MSTTNDELTEADLEWFNLERYRTALMYSDLRSWANVLDHRIYIKQLLDRGWPIDRRMARRRFEALKEDPHALLRRFYIENEIVTLHPTDTPSVRFTRIFRILSAASDANHINVPSSEIFNIALNRTNDQWRHGKVNIEVDLAAPREQIKDDFNSWLKRVDALPVLEALSKPTVVKKRFASADFRRWVNLNYLPYFDLHLFSLIENKSIPPDLMLKLLEIKWSKNEDPLNVLRLSMRGMKIFTYETFYAMHAQIAAETHARMRKHRLTKSENL